MQQPSKWEPLRMFLEKGPDGRLVTQALWGSLLMGIMGLLFPRPHPFLFFFVCFFVMSGLMILGFYFLCRRQMSPETLKFLADIESIKSIPIDAAREKATRILNDGGEFTCWIEPVEHFSQEEKLPPLVREFFGKYTCITNACATLDRENIVPSAYMDGAWAIGNIELECELAVTPSSETVYEFQPSDDPIKECQQYPSVYHWILSEYRVWADDDDSEPST